jgi:hypothetical protein
MQQVNLYSEILKQEQKQSDLKLVAGAFMALALLCLAFTGYLLWDIGKTETDLQKARDSLKQQQALVNEMVAKKTNTGPDNQLLAEIEQWQKSVNEAAQTLQLLAGNETILKQGFSFYLQSLAMQSNPEIWFTAIHVDGHKGEMKLEGSTFKPQQIPFTLEQLQDKPALKGLKFAKLVMKQSEKVPGQIDFTLGSPEPPKNANDNVQ